LYVSFRLPNKRGRRRRKVTQNYSNKDSDTTTTTTSMRSNARGSRNMIPFGSKIENRKSKIQTAHAADDSFFHHVHESQGERRHWLVAIHSLELELEMRDQFVKEGSSGTQEQISFMIILEREKEQKVSTLFSQRVSLSVKSSSCFSTLRTHLRRCCLLDELTLTVPSCLHIKTGFRDPPLWLQCIPYEHTHRHRHHH
jgi:hypothetical protein